MKPKWKNRSATPTYWAWSDMRRRCHDPKHEHYPDYGGRGISVCDRWRHDYDAFVEDLGLRPNGLTLERDDTNGNYEPLNCRWATWAEQRRNRRSNRHVTFAGQTRTIAEWSRELRVSRWIISDRVKRGLMPLQYDL